MRKHSFSRTVVAPVRLVPQRSASANNGCMMSAKSHPRLARRAGRFMAVFALAAAVFASATASATTPPSSGPTTTLLQIELPPGATTKPAKVTKRTTTTRKKSKRKATKATTTTIDRSLRQVPTEVPTDPETPSTQPGKVVVGNTPPTVAPGKGVDLTITTVLAPDQVPNAVPDATWLALRQCESHNNYEINTGNGYYGAYQFASGTWKRLGYSGLPHRAAPAVQDEAAKRLQAKSGWGQWPACSRKLGLRA
jgi:Transglycosylase-like domain